MGEGLLDKAKLLGRLKSFHDHYLNKIDTKKSRVSKKDLGNLSVALDFRQLVEEVVSGTFDAVDPSVTELAITALEFYASAEKYTVKHWLDNEIEIRKDGGDKARSTLAEIKMSMQEGEGGQA